MFEPPLCDEVGRAVRCRLSWGTVTRKIQLAKQNGRMGKKDRGRARRGDEESGEGSRRSSIVFGATRCSGPNGGGGGMRGSGGGR